jgi:uncharacterized protein (DUF2141 family)
MIASTTVFAQQAVPHDLRVNVLGLQNPDGQAIVRLYREGDDLFGSPRLQLAAPIANLAASGVFKTLEPGRNACIAFDDANGNGQLDHNLLRLPAEPLGFSNGFQLGLLSGKPDTHKLAFTLGAEDLAINITVR